MKNDFIIMLPTLRATVYVHKNDPPLTIEQDSARTTNALINAAVQAAKDGRVGVVRVPDVNSQSNGASK